MTIWKLVSFYHCAGIACQYSTSLWAGRFVDRIPVGKRYSAVVLKGPGVHLAPCMMGTGSLLRG